MHYIARLKSKKPLVDQKPLQALSYGSTIDALREWAKLVLVTEPTGARVDVYERVETKCTSFIKVKKEKTDVILEEPVVPPAPGGGASPAVAQPCDAVTARIVGIEAK
jgi:hypothetical protein